VSVVRGHDRVCLWEGVGVSPVGYGCGRDHDLVESRPDRDLRKLGGVVRGHDRVCLWEGFFGLEVDVLRQFSL
jgi:hypothetical protein